MENIKTQITREEADKINRELHLNFFQEIQNLNIGFHTELRGRISDWSIELGIINSDEDYVDNIYYPDFNSDIKIYREDSDRVEMFNKPEFTIYSSSTSSMTPNTPSTYWKTKHSFIILENWDIVMELCAKYIDLFNKRFDNYEIV